MKKIGIAIGVILIILFFIFYLPSNKLEKLFYITTDARDFSFSSEQLQQIKNHAKSIDIIAPQIFHLDESGAIHGGVDAKILAVAKENNIKVMPLIINSRFDQEKLHLFLHNSIAQETAISKMLALCQQYHFYGLQFDFENIHVKDKNEFTRFFELAAKRLHQDGYTISIAVIPRTSDIFNNDYDRWYFENWSGAYDYEALGQSADFVTVMSYDQHTSLTTPGPVAAIDWVEKNVQAMLRVIPAKKISLGIPTYSAYWSTGKFGAKNIPEKYTFRSKENAVSYANAIWLLNKLHQSLLWQNQWQSAYVLYSNNDKTEYIFVENAKSFQAKLKLAKRYHLRGISIWKLGLEDPAIWKKGL